MKQLVRTERGRYGPLDAAGDGANRLWMFRGGPPQAEASILMWRDGRVYEMAHPSLALVTAADFTLVGGHELRLDADDWRHDVLVAAGYSFREVGP